MQYIDRTVGSLSTSHRLSSIASMYRHLFDRILDQVGIRTVKFVDLIQNFLYKFGNFLHHISDSFDLNSLCIKTSFIHRNIIHLDKDKHLTDSDRYQIHR